MKKALLSLLVLHCFCFAVQAQLYKASSNKSRVFEGTIRTLISEDKSGTRRHFLDAGNGKSFEIALADESVSGAKVSITGKLADENKIIPENIKVLESPRANLQATVEGLRKTLVLLINFQNDTAQPVSTGQVKSRIFTGATSTNQYYKQVSGGKLQLTGIQNADGDVFGYYTIPFTNQNCSANSMVNEWAPSADNIALSNGVNANSYNSVIYLFTGEVPNCDVAIFGDLSDIGDRRTQRVYFADPFNEFNARFFQYYIAHEIGHNIGLNHVSGYNFCPPDQPFESCGNYVEYSDRADIMGNFGYHLLNNYNRLRLGWLSGKLSVYDAPGTYNVVLFSPGHFAKSTTAAQIRLKDAAGNFTGKSIFLEYRRNMPPFDVFAPGESPLSPVQLSNQGVTLRIGNENLLDRLSHPLVIDTRPATNDFGDAALLPGDSYANAYYGITVTNLTSNPFFGSRVRIHLNR